MDGFRDIARGTMNPAEAARARMATVAETKIVPQFLRELRIERKEALTRATAERDEPTLEVAQGPAARPGTRQLSPNSCHLHRHHAGRRRTEHPDARGRGEGARGSGQVMPLAPSHAPAGNFRSWAGDGKPGRSGAP